MKIVYEINDRKGLETLCKNEDMTDKQIKQLLDGNKDLHVIYTLEGNKRSGTLSYTLVDAKTKEKVSIHSLNGYEKGYINDCFTHFHTGNKEILKDGFINILQLSA